MPLIEHLSYFIRVAKENEPIQLDKINLFFLFAGMSFVQETNLRRFVGQAQFQCLHVWELELDGQGRSSIENSKNGLIVLTGSRLSSDAILINFLRQKPSAV